MSDLIMPKPDVKLVCEAKVATSFGTKIPCRGDATHIYGPECERETGRLMYLCDSHAVGIQLWKDMNPNEPVECPTHGRIGRVKDYVVLVRI